MRAAQQDQAGDKEDGKTRADALQIANRFVAEPSNSAGMRNKDQRKPTRGVCRNSEAHEQQAISTHKSDGHVQPWWKSSTTVENQRAP
jgi:hypothetical protein